MHSLKPFTVCGFKSTEIKIVLKMPNKQILMIMKNSRYHLNATMKLLMLSNCCSQKSKPVRLNLKNARECWLKHNLRKMKYVHFSKVQVKPMRNSTEHWGMLLGRLKKRKKQLLQPNQKLIGLLLKSKSSHPLLGKQKKNSRNLDLNLKKKKQNSKLLVVQERRLIVLL